MLPRPAWCSTARCARCDPRHCVYVVPRPGDLIVVGAEEIESEDTSPASLRTTD